MFSFHLKTHAQTPLYVTSDRRGISDWQILATLNVETCPTFKHAMDTFDVMKWREPVKRRTICLRSANGLIPGCRYNFRVRSVNCGGVSKYSASSQTVELTAREMSRMDGISRTKEKYLEQFGLREELRNAATAGGLKGVVFPSRVCKKMRQYKSECNVQVWGLGILNASASRSLRHLSEVKIIETVLDALEVHHYSSNIQIDACRFLGHVWGSSDSVMTPERNKRVLELVKRARGKFNSPVIDWAAQKVRKAIRKSAIGSVKFGKFVKRRGKRW